MISGQIWFNNWNSNLKSYLMFIEMTWKIALESCILHTKFPITIVNRSFEKFANWQFIFLVRNKRKVFLSLSRYICKFQNYEEICQCFISFKVFKNSPYFIHKVPLAPSKCLSKWTKVDKWDYLQNGPKDFFFSFCF